MRRAALYARVSTRRQEQEATIESQLDQLVRYAQEHELEISPGHQYIDQAVSGKRLARPGLDQLRDGVVAGEFEMVLCLSPDRLARNLGAQQVVLDELERYRVGVIFLNQPQREESPQGKLMLEIQGAFAEYERTLICERMRRGRLYRLRQGQSVSNLAPYGYRYQPPDRTHANTWVVIEAEAALVRQIYQEYTIEQISLRQLTHRLNDQHIPSPRGGHWTETTVMRVLRQAAYKGTGYYNCHQLDDTAVGKPRRQGTGLLQFPRYLPRPMTEWIGFPVPPIIDESLWQAAQERRKMQAQYASRNSHRPYLLRSLLVCGMCGYTLTARTQKGVVTYYCKHGRVHCPPNVPQHTCSVPAKEVETLIWNSLAQLLDNPLQIRQAWEAVQQAPDQAGERERLQQRQSALAKQRQRLVDAYQVDLITLEDLRQRQIPLDQELQQLHARLTQFSEPKTEISLEMFTHSIRLALTTCDFDTRQEVIRLLIERIVVTEDALTVEHIVPTMNNSRLHDVDHANE